MEIFTTIPGAPQPVGPYSVAVKAGGLLFCAGQVALDPATSQLIDAGIEEQTERVLLNLKAVLEGAGSSFHEVVMTTIFLKDISHGRMVNDIYRRFVDPDRPPARQTIAVKDLPLGALVEISAIAALS